LGGVGDCVGGGVGVGDEWWGVAYGDVDGGLMMGEEEEGVVVNGLADFVVVG